MQRTKHTAEISWLRQEVEGSCELRQKVEMARYDASYPGIPPGIPLMPLFGNWMIGICFLQQMLALGVAWLVVMLLRRQMRRASRPVPVLWRVFGLLLVAAVSIGSGVLLFTGIPTTRLATVFLIGLLVLVIAATNGIGKRRSEKAILSEGEKNTFAAQEKRVSDRWRLATTGRMLGLTLLPGFVLLYHLRPQLSFLHPVATLLVSIMGGTQAPTAKDALALAVMNCGLPIAFALLVCFWSLYRRVLPLAGVLVGMARFALPAAACLSVSYLILLDRTLQLDAAASHAISEVAHNDLQWVLTHSSPPPPEEESSAK